MLGASSVSKVEEEEGERQREISDGLQSAIDEVSELKRQRNQWIEKIKRF